MTDEQRKRLTLYLGECWHEIIEVIIHDDEDGDYTEDRCKNCDRRFGGDYLIRRRTFTTDADMMALFRKLVNSLNFGAFQNFAYKRFDDPRNYTLTEWLFYDPERFCCLVAEWIESNKTKKGGNK